jgi:hypothetical protein
MKSGPPKSLIQIKNDGLADEHGRNERMRRPAVKMEYPARMWLPGLHFVS